MYPNINYNNNYTSMTSDVYLFHQVAAPVYTNLYPPGCSTNCPKSTKTNVRFLETSVYIHTDKLPFQEVLMYIYWWLLRNKLVTKWAGRLCYCLINDTSQPLNGRWPGIYLRADICMWTEMSKQTHYSSVFMWPDLAHISDLIWRQTTNDSGLDNWHMRKYSVFNLVINERWREDLREKGEGGGRKRREVGRERNNGKGEGKKEGIGRRQRRGRREGEKEAEEGGRERRGGGRERKKGKEAWRERRGGRERKKRREGEKEGEGGMERKKGRREGEKEGEGGMETRGVGSERDKGERC